MTADERSADSKRWNKNIFLPGFLAFVRVSTPVEIIYNPNARDIGEN
jgi:hypothetical protein